jgi:hypothetical protein
MEFILQQWEFNYVNEFTLVTFINFSRGAAAASGSDWPPQMQPKNSRTSGSGVDW